MTRQELINAIVESVSTRSRDTLRGLIADRVNYPVYVPKDDYSAVKLPPHEERNYRGRNDKIRASRYLALTYRSRPYGAEADPQAKLARKVVDNITASIDSHFKWPRPSDAVLPSDMEKTLARRARRSK